MSESSEKNFRIGTTCLEDLEIRRPHSFLEAISDKDIAYAIKEIKLPSEGCVSITSTLQGKSAALVPSVKYN